MKKLMRIMTTVLVFSMLMSMAATAAPSPTKVRRTYRSYVLRNLKKSKYPYRKTRYYDINKDGIKELIVSYEAGVRIAYQFYTYHNGRVKKMHKSDFYGCNGISAMTNNRKYICITQSNGASDSSETIYKMSNRKLKKVATYRMKGNRVYRNGKRVSKSKIRAVWRHQMPI